MITTMKALRKAWTEYEFTIDHVNAAPAKFWQILIQDECGCKIQKRITM